MVLTKRVIRLHKLNGDPQEYSDVVIHSAAERPYYVHRAIVCPRSEYLSKKCLPITEKPVSAMY